MVAELIRLRGFWLIPATVLAFAAQAAPPVLAPPAANPPAPLKSAVPEAPSPDVADAPPPPQARPPHPFTPGPPQRMPVAILRAVDKVSAQSMMFAAPVGRRVRFRSLVFEVKACALRDAGEARARASAYVVITADPRPGAEVLGAQAVFKGWMFSEAPGLNPLSNPTYDAWLVSCANAVDPQTSGPKA